MAAPHNTTPRPPLTHAQKRVIKIVVAIIGALGAASFGSAYNAVSGWAGTHGFQKPFSMMLPLILDGAVVASLMGAVLFTSLNMHRWWMHLVSAGLAFPTVYLNWQAGTVPTANAATVAHAVAAKGTTSASIAHAAVAAVYIVFAEIGQWALRSWMRREGILPHDVIRGSRWIVAPVQTGRIKMRMIKWEIASYSEALEAEKQRLRAVATARRLFGRRWRHNIGGDVRLGLSLGEVSEEHIKALVFRLAAERGTAAVPKTVPSPVPTRVPQNALQNVPQNVLPSVPQNSVPPSVPQNTERPPAERPENNGSTEHVPPLTTSARTGNAAERGTERAPKPSRPRAERNASAGVEALSPEELRVLDRIRNDNGGAPSVRAITAGFRADGLTIATAAAMDLARTLKADAANPDRPGALDTALSNLSNQAGNTDGLL